VTVALGPFRDPFLAEGVATVPGCDRSRVVGDYGRASQVVVSVEVGRVVAVFGQLLSADRHKKPHPSAVIVFTRSHYEVNRTARPGLRHPVTGGIIAVRRQIHTVREGGHLVSGIVGIGIGSVIDKVSGSIVRPGTHSISRRIDGKVPFRRRSFVLVCLVALN